MNEILRSAGYAIFVLLIWQVGNWFCRGILAMSGASSPSESTIRAGRYIGLLERLLILIGIIVRSWEIVAAVVALKTVARYQELDEKINAEYFLLGSLASIFWAVLVALALLLYDRTLGLHIFDSLVAAASVVPSA